MKIINVKSRHCDRESKMLNSSAPKWLDHEGETAGSLKTEEVWFTTEQAAAYLGISAGELRNKTSCGQIPYYKLGRLNRYLHSELRELLLKNKRGVQNGN